MESASLPRPHGSGYEFDHPSLFVVIAPLLAGCTSPKEAATGSNSHSFRACAGNAVGSEAVGNQRSSDLAGPPSATRSMIGSC